MREIFRARSINVSAFAREHGVKPTTLYNILNGSTAIDNVGISTFMRIAHGLGMSSDELADLLDVGRSRIEYAVVGFGDGETDD